MTANHTIETERLKLKLITPDDDHFLFRLMNTDKWFKYIGDKGITSTAQAHQYIRDKMDDNVWSKGFVNHVIIPKNTGQPVGTCSLHNRHGVDGLDVGYALLSMFEGNGFAQEGVRAMIEKAFYAYNQIKVSAITSVDNKQSYLLLEKIGFVYKRLIHLPGSEEEVKLYQYNRKV